MLLAFLVFVSDALIAYLGGIYFDARSAGKIKRALYLSALFDAAIGVNAMGFVELKWPMLVPSVLGGLLGTWLSLRADKASEQKPLTA